MNIYGVPIVITIQSANGITLRPQIYDGHLLIPMIGNDLAYYQLIHKDLIKEIFADEEHNDR